MSNTTTFIHGHCCNNVTKERKAHMVNGCWAYRCDCGDTVFVDPSRFVDPSGHVAE